jgi:hypothetical protein
VSHWFLQDAENSAAAVQCLDAMVVDALRHVPSCLEYMSRLRNRQVFRFCAIPQVMAIATLALCYGNHGVFTGQLSVRPSVRPSVCRVRRAQCFDGLVGSLVQGLAMAAAAQRSRSAVPFGRAGLGARVGAGGLCLSQGLSTLGPIWPAQQEVLPLFGSLVSGPP